MGFISDLASGKATFPGQTQGQATWRQIFGTNKEEPPRPRSQRDGPSSFVRSAADPAAIKRLLQAYRSGAPGGWSDNRYEESGHQVGITHISIHRAAEILSQAEFQVFQKDPRAQDGKRPVESNHPLVKLLEHPNDEDSFGELMYSAYQQMNLTGSWLLWKVPNALGQPMELYPLETAIAVPQPVVNPDYPEGYYRIQPLYPYGPFSSYPTPNSAAGAIVPARWVTRVKFRHPLIRWDGYSPLTAMRLHLDEVESIDRSRFYSMKGSVNPSAVLNFDEVEGMQPLPEHEINRIHAEWENSFQGPENAGKLIVGTPGGKFEPWGGKPIDMDYVQGWSQLVDFCLAAFGITKGAAGMTEGISSYAALFAMLKQLHMLTLSPFCNRIAGRMTRDVAPHFGDDLIVEIRCPKIDDHDLSSKNVNTLTGMRGMPKTVIKYVMRQLDMPVDEEMIEELSQPEQPPGGAPGGMPGEMPGAVPGAEMGAPAAGGQQPEIPMEIEKILAGSDGAPEIDETQPGTGSLGEGSLGPRAKSMKKKKKAVLPPAVQDRLLPSRNGFHKVKSFYDQTMEVLKNGHG